MRWTDKMIDSFDRSQQVEALTCVRDYLQACKITQEKLDAANEKISEVQIQAEKLKHNPFVGLVIIGLVFLFFLVKLVVGGMIGFILMVVLFLLYLNHDRKKNAKQREEKAAAFYAQNAAPALQEKEQAETTLKLLHESDDAYNCTMLLPGEYLTLGRTQALLDLLSQRRVRTITEAMDMYEKRLHQQRVEKMEEERLKAAQEGAEAQKEAAASAKNTEKMTKELTERQKELEYENSRLKDSVEKMKTSTRRSTRDKTKPCYYCRQEISIKASACPYCGTTPPLWWYV